MHPLVQFDRLHPDGLAAGQADGETLLCCGVLPGEQARVRKIRRRGHAWLCLPEEILEPARGRRPAREEHYLSCSPWQVFDEATQIFWKQQWLAQLFPHAESAAFYPAPQSWHYRNKMEFSFTEQRGRLALAFHRRWSPFAKIPLPQGCLLARPVLNQAAQALVERLQACSVSARQLKTLVVRCDRHGTTVVAALYVTDETFPVEDFRGGELAGLAILYSDPHSPASVATRALGQFGSMELCETVAGLPLRYRFDSFFQIYPEMFDQAVTELGRWVAPAEQVIELYSGVGAIGLVLCTRLGQVVAIEAHPGQVAYAQRNAQALAATNYRAVAGRVEDLAEQFLAGADVVVADPPRAGLHPKLLAALARHRPRRIVYLSCNPMRQAADVAQLSSAYHPVACVGFDFYPQTPHLEAAVILDRRS